MMDSADGGATEREWTTFYLGAPPAFAQPGAGRACESVEALGKALAEVNGPARVVVTAQVSERALAAVGERFPAVQWWSAHGRPCADAYARHALPRALAHAIRSPMGVLEGAIEELAERLGEDGPEWGMARRSLARLRRVAVSLSDVASLVAMDGHSAESEGGAPLAGASLRDVVVGAWQEAQQLWPLRQEVELALDSLEVVERAPAATGALTRALRELFVNARQHGASHVRVQAAIDAQGVRVEVLDDGPGPGSARDTANWSPFVAAHSRGARSDLAVGLGIAHADARALGGTLEVGSGPQDMGTRARLSWPVEGA